MLDEYERFRCRDGVIPAPSYDSAKKKPSLRTYLELWNADLGAHDRMAWDWFLAEYRDILAPLASLPRLGELDQDQLESVSLAVVELEQFKRTKARHLVFGSKAAHFTSHGSCPS